MKEISKHNFI